MAYKMYVTKVGLKILAQMEIKSSGYFTLCNHLADCHCVNLQQWSCEITVLPYTTFQKQA